MRGIEGEKLRSHDVQRRRLATFSWQDWRAAVKGDGTDRARPTTCKGKAPWHAIGAGPAERGGGGAGLGALQAAGRDASGSAGSRRG